MKFLETHILDNNERLKYEAMGLYCYDLRDSDYGEDIASIEKRVLINRIGSIITNKEIKFNSKINEYLVDYNYFVENNKRVNSIKELLKNNKERKCR